MNRDLHVAGGKLVAIGIGRAVGQEVRDRVGQHRARRGVVGLGRRLLIQEEAKVLDQRAHLEVDGPLPHVPVPGDPWNGMGGNGMSASFRLMSVLVYGGSIVRRTSVLGGRGLGLLPHAQLLLVRAPRVRALGRGAAGAVGFADGGEGGLDIDAPLETV